MADISKCSGEGCSLKNRCYRFTVKSSTYQSFFSTPPNRKPYKCSYFWENLNENNNNYKENE